MNKKTIISFLIICLFSISFLTCSESDDSNTLTNQTQPDTVNIATWNIRILSDNSRNDNELTKISEIIKRYDLVAIQEVRDTTVLDRLKAMLTGYDYIVSTPVGNSVMELYAYFYKSSLFTVEGTPYVYDDTNDDFIREPFIANFKAGGFDFTLITIHVLYGDTVADRRAEIMLLDEVVNQVDIDGIYYFHKIDAF